MKRWTIEVITRTLVALDAEDEEEACEKAEMTAEDRFPDEVIAEVIDVREK